MAIVNIVSRWDSTKVVYTTTVSDSIPPSRRVAVALERAVMKGISLLGIDLSYCDLGHANLREADLQCSLFGVTNLRFAKLARANLANSVFRNAIADYVDFDGANLRNVEFLSTNLGGSTIRKATLEGTTFLTTNLRQVNFMGSTFQKVRLGAEGAVAQAVRSDGHSFQLIDCADGKFRVMAGCRWFTLPEAWRHWEKTRRNTRLGEETFDILVMFEHQAERRRKPPRLRA